MEYFAEGSPDSIIDRDRARVLLGAMLRRVGRVRRVLLLPPDYTRVHSWAGPLTVMLYEQLADDVHVEIMPTLGTHAPMTDDRLRAMFPGIPRKAFRVHDWRGGLTRLGEIPPAIIREITRDRVDLSVCCEINRLLVDDDWDHIISIGQLVPHEVVGIANHSKNIFVGAGGQDTINKTHYIGAACDMEAIMGRTNTPVRAVFDYMTAHYARDLPISYLLTVRAPDASGGLVTRGMFAGDDNVCFRRGAALCRQVNVVLLEKPLRKVVVYLDPSEYKSAWLGNKSIYRTRMALAPEGELIVLAPGVTTFGEDAEIDRLIREYGYRGRSRTLQMVAENVDLAANLSAAAHLIHGSSEGRFRVTYCTGGLSRHEMESVGFAYGDVIEMVRRFPPDRLRYGWNEVADEQVFYVPNPGLGLWALRSRFEESTARKV